jgi:hypothetical protein
MTTTRAAATATIPEQPFTQARVRVNQDGAELLWQLVLAEETRQLTHRRQVDDPERPLMQESLKTVRRLKDEIERVLIEQGWND